MLYIVMQSSLDYDDQCYTHCEGGHPLKVFRDKQKAEDHRVELEVDHWFSNGHPGLDEFYDTEFKEGWEEFILSASKDGVCAKIIEESLDINDVIEKFSHYSKNWTIDKKKEFIEKYMYIHMYLVHEVKDNIVE